MSDGSPGQKYNSIIQEEYFARLKTLYLVELRHWPSACFDSGPIQLVLYKAHLVDTVTVTTNTFVSFSLDHFQFHLYQ